MEGERRLSLIVGGFVIASLAFLAAAVMLLSSERGIFTPQYRLVASFENVQGLLAGAPVWLAGKEVGSVERIRFGDAAVGAPLSVVLRIDERVQERIRADSVARIGTIGLLGDSYVEVTIGSPEAPVLGDGERIQAVDPASLQDALATGTHALESIASLAQNLDEVVKTFSSGGGGAGMAEAVGAVNDIVMEVREGSGLLHSIVYDQYEGGGVESIERSLAALENILEQVRSGEGILHSLIYEPPAEQDLVMQALEAGARLNSILEKVDRGEGTVGLLVNDPTLYDDLKVLLGGAQRSVVVRSLIRMATDGDGR